MQTYIVAVITISAIFVAVTGFIYYWCTKKVPLHATDFSFDDVYCLEEAR